MSCTYTYLYILAGNSRYLTALQRERYIITTTEYWQFQRNHISMISYNLAGSSRYLLIHCSSWFITVYHDLPCLSWFIIVFHGSACFYHGLSCFIMVYHCCSWFIMVSWVSWFTMVYHGVAWFIMVYHGLLWFTIAYHCLALFSIV